MDSEPTPTDSPDRSDRFETPDAQESRATDVWNTHELFREAPVQRLWFPREGKGGKVG